MKKFVFCLFTLLPLFAMADGAHVVCKSDIKAPRYPENSGQWILEYDLYADSEFLGKMELKIKSKKDLGEFILFSEPDTYSKKINVYKMQDSYCEYSIYLPAKISNVDGSYTAVIDYSCTNGERNVFNLTCVEQP